MLWKRVAAIVATLVETQVAVYAAVVGILFSFLRLEKVTACQRVVAFVFDWRQHLRIPQRSERALIMALAEVEQRIRARTRLSSPSQFWGLTWHATGCMFCF